jgi:hypothetical protein
VKLVVSFACALCICMPVSGYAEPNYYLERCKAHGDDRIGLSFVGSGGRVRRLHMHSNGIELSGDVKGSVNLRSVKELRLEPKLTIEYFSGKSTEFGALTVQCRERIRRVAKRLSVPVRDTDG